MGFENPKIRGGVASPQSVFETSTTKYHQIGTSAYFDDGRAFRYARFSDSTAIGPNKLAQQAAPVANHVSETGAQTGITSAGARQVTLVLGATAATASQYADGYLVIESATTGAGQIFKIVDHDAVSSAGTITFDIYNPVVTATTGTETWTLIANPYADVIIAPTTNSAPAAGGTLCNFAAATTAAPRYGWIQTWGVGSCLGDTSNKVFGAGLIQGTTTAGALAVAVETDIKERVAICMQTITTDDVYLAVDWRIAP